MMVVEEDATLRHARFWDRHAIGYSNRPIADEAAYQTKLEAAREHLRPDSVVLEFGCGTGGTARLHAPFVKHILATDISNGMLEIARERAAAEGVENVEFRRASIEDLDLPDGSFDAVLGLSILHLLRDPDAAIAKVHRLLKPGGVFISSTVCLGDFMRIFGLIAPLGRMLGLLPLVQILKADELEAKFAPAGFEIVHRWRPGEKTLFLIVRKPA